MAEAEDLPGRLRAGTVLLNASPFPGIERWEPDETATDMLLDEAASEIERLTTRAQSLEVENARLLGEVEEANRQRCRLADRALAEAQRAQAAEAALALAREGLEDTTDALRRLISKYGYEDDGVTPKDWSEYVDAREAVSRAAQVYASIKDGGEVDAGSEAQAEHRETKPILPNPIEGRGP